MAAPKRYLLKAKESVPEQAKRILRRLRMEVLDIGDFAERRRDMIPPRTMSNFVGGSDYKSTGLEFRRLFVEYGGLEPEHKVLDVGCGIGRMAVPLTSYLSPEGEYQGFDIVEGGIQWCQKNITPRFPNFHFAQANVLNKYYNPGGIYQADSYRFPFEDERFDFIFLTSVFTHMFPRDLENYLKEISRVLRKGQSCFITFFLMNEESKSLVQKGLSSQNFVHPLDGCITTSLENPEGALAFSEEAIRELFTRYGLTIREPVRYGSWCGRSEFLSYQDIVIATKD
jgi:ubiquinone/menaquinone biosynthesis C-methylase UbiE